ncbi:DUF3883 domain-containing protein [Halomonas sp. 18H]|nr:DUF3883 domain-containing protein [Halomonas sp. 18H]MCW4148546.1 DUF3883 domain-containing protein [Halomonas sp. 18H]
MSRKIALKKLTLSDLTIFEYHFRQGKAGNQKSINLNRNVFEKLFYPNLTAIAEEQEWESFILNLTIMGPGNVESQVLPQKIKKGDSYKNWRLNGKYIATPDGDNRYQVLDAGDYAIMEFIGAAWPTQMKMTLVAANHPDDAGLHSAIKDLYQKTRMKALTPEELTEVERLAGDLIPISHPFRDLLDTQDLEDAAQGGIEGVQNLRKRRRSRGVSLEELRKAKKAAENIGHLGEEILNQYLSEQVGQSIESYQWVASENAIAPYDFEVVHNGAKQLIDAKSTGGPFSNPIHVSLAELREMAESEHCYRIYRLYEVKEDYSKLTISAAMASMAASILACVDDSLKGNELSGVTVDSVSIRPETIEWEEELVIDIQESDDTE